MTTSVLDALDGKPWLLGGVDGILRVERVNGMTEVVHHPSEYGQLSVNYRRHRRELGDDYTTTLTADEKVLDEIFDKIWK